MDGETALWYVRSRYSTSDFDRTRRQQEVLQAIFYKLLSFDMVKKVPDIYKKLQEAIQTDMSLDDLISLIPVAGEFKNPKRINRFAVGPEHVSSWVNPYNVAQVLLPNQYLIRELMKQALNIK